MITVETTVFICEHCRKKQFRKSDMAKHEKWCNKNPANKHICFEFCAHLVKGREKIEDYDEETSATRTTFYCSALDKLMYSSIAERRNIVRHLSDCERMPLECDKYVHRDTLLQAEIEGANNFFEHL